MSLQYARIHCAVLQNMRVWYVRVLYATIQCEDTDYECIVCHVQPISVQYAVKWYRV